MAIKINVGSAAVKAAEEEEERKPEISLNLNVRKTLAGDFMVFDHSDINIVVMPAKGKVSSFAKNDLTSFTMPRTGFLLFLLRKELSTLILYREATCICRLRGHILRKLRM